jgi:hypothetical protein
MSDYTALEACVDALLAETIRRELVGYVCRHPQELFTAGAKCVMVVPGTKLVVPVVLTGAPFAPCIGFTPDSCSDLRLRDIEDVAVAELLARSGVGVRAAVSWSGDGFAGHLEVWEPNGVLDALGRLRRFFDDCWPTTEGDVAVAAPPPGSASTTARLDWRGDGQAYGEVRVTCDGAATMIARMSAALGSSRAAMLELFEGLDPILRPDGSLRFVVELSTAQVEVDIADAADWRVHRTDGPVAG